MQGHQPKSIYLAKITTKKRQLLKAKMLKGLQALKFIRKVKMQQELQFMYRLTRPIIEMALADKFSTPQKRICKNKKKLSGKFGLVEGSVTTMDTMGSLDSMDALSS